MLILAKIGRLLEDQCVLYGGRTQKTYVSLTSSGQRKQVSLQGQTTAIEIKGCKEELASAG